MNIIKPTDWKTKKKNLKTIRKINPLPTRLLILFFRHNISLAKSYWYYEVWVVKRAPAWPAYRRWGICARWWQAIGHWSLIGASEKVRRKEERVELGPVPYHWETQRRERQVPRYSISRLSIPRISMTVWCSPRVAYTLHHSVIIRTLRTGRSMILSVTWWPR